MARTGERISTLCLITRMGISVMPLELLLSRVRIAFFTISAEINLKEKGLVDKSPSKLIEY